MIVFFVIGWVFLAAAFVAAAFETMAFMVSGTGGLMLSAFDLWYTYWPGNLVVTQVIIERDFHPFLWDPVLLTALQLPAWGILGAPGMALIWSCRPRRASDPEEELDEEALFLYDALAEQALAEGIDPDEDDMAPDHGLDDELIGDGVTITDSVEEFMGDLDTAPLDGGGNDDR
jgi:hypothetical protein